MSHEIEYKDIATIPLMSDEESSRNSESSIHSRLTSRRKEYSSLVQYAKAFSPWYFHGLLMLSYTILFAGLMISIKNLDKSHKKSEHEHRRYPLPAREGLQWENRRFLTKIDGNPFVGEPRDELHDAWHNLLQNDNIKVPRDYLDELGLDTIYTKDGSEGIASLSVYHSLHCLKKVHHMMYKEFYHEGKDSIAMHREARHADHCLEYIREHVMCQPDLSLVTFRWINNTAQHPEYPAKFYATNFDASEHMCAKWEPLDSWAGNRVFSLSNFDQLQRPGEDGNTVVQEIQPIKGEIGYQSKDRKNI